MNAKQKKNLLRIIVAALLLVTLSYAPLSGAARFAAYLVPYLIIGYDILGKAAKGIKNRRPFDECLLMAIATIGAMALAVYEDGDYTEGIAVMLFYQIGEWFQSYAVGRSRQNISDLMDICPEYAHAQNEAGEFVTVDPSDVAVGTVILVKPGEKIPLDGTIISGRSALNTVALTGESLPRDVGDGDEVCSGCINLHGPLQIKTTKEFDESTAGKIMELVEDASSRKARSEQFIAKFARVYTPLVVYAALALAVVPPLVNIIGGASEAAWGMWVYRALTFLVISCPCALVISIPLSFFAGLGGASRKGILIKGSDFLETLAAVKTVVFDKTGTLTKGVFDVTAIHPTKLSADDLLHLAAHVERFSTHPIAESLRNAYANEADTCDVVINEEIAGTGIRARVNGREVCVGNGKMMDKIGVAWYDCTHVGTIVHIAVDNEYAGHVVIADTPKPSSAVAVAALREVGVEKIVMLTGDSKRVAAQAALEIGVDNYHSELMPQDKVSKVEKLIASGRGKVAFVGDGINDAPVLSRADVGIAMGAMGSDAAIEAADIVLMDDDLYKIVIARQIAVKTMRIVRENIAFSIGVKVLVLCLGAVGLANMWAAIFADVGVMILAVLNSIRALYVGALPQNATRGALPLDPGRERGPLPPRI